MQFVGLTVHCGSSRERELFCNYTRTQKTWFEWKFYFYLKYITILNGYCMKKMSIYHFNCQSMYSTQWTKTAMKNLWIQHCVHGQMRTQEKQQRVWQWLTAHKAWKRCQLQLQRKKSLPINAVLDFSMCVCEREISGSLFPPLTKKNRFLRLFFSFYNCDI